MSTHDYTLLYITVICVFSFLSELYTPAGQSLCLAHICFLLGYLVQSWGLRKGVFLTQAL